MTLPMPRLLKYVVSLAITALLLTGGTVVWAMEAESSDFAFVPRASQLALPVVTLEDQKPPPADAGSVYFSTIGVRRATVFETWVGVDDGGALVPEHALISPGESDEDRTRLEAVSMTTSEEAAEVVALRALGTNVTVKPAGVRVLGISIDAPIGKDGAQIGDIVITVDDATITTIASLRSALTAVGANRPVTLTIRRGSNTKRIETTTTAAADGTVMLGIVPRTANLIETPRAVTFSVEGVGGPSGGLAFALQIYSAGKDYSNLHRLRVVATGTLSMDGKVGPIGGATQKAIGAGRVEADLFLVPIDNLADAKQAAPSGVTVIGVASFDDALRAIARAT